VEVRLKRLLKYFDFDVPLWKRGIEGNGTYLSAENQGNGAERSDDF